MRRRRNPDRTQWVLLAGLGVAAYFVYRYLSGALSSAATAVSNTASATSSKIADIAEALLPHSVSTAALAPGATILLGNGQEIPVSAATGVGQFTDADGTLKFQFYYQGAIWRTTSSAPDDTNTYYATSGS